MVIVLVLGYFIGFFFLVVFDDLRFGEFLVYLLVVFLMLGFILFEVEKI